MTVRTLDSGHWLLIYNKKLVSQHGTRRMAEKEAIALYNLNTESAISLRRSLVVKIPRCGYVEITMCDCLDGKHEGEL